MTCPVHTQPDSTTDQAPAPEQIRMKATASEDGRITQTGGDRT
ncbi:hypothetical protein [Streptomyces coeruleorubidus]